MNLCVNVYVCVCVREREGNKSSEHHSIFHILIILCYASAVTLIKTRNAYIKYGIRLQS